MLKRIRRAFFRRVPQTPCRRIGSSIPRSFAKGETSGCVTPVARHGVQWNVLVFGSGHATHMSTGRATVMVRRLGVRRGASLVTCVGLLLLSGHIKRMSSHIPSLMTAHMFMCTLSAVSTAVATRRATLVVSDGAYSGYLRSAMRVQVNNVKWLARGSLASLPTQLLIFIASSRERR